MGRRDLLLVGGAAAFVAACNEPATADTSVGTAKSLSPGSETARNTGISKFVADFNKGMPLSAFGEKIQFLVFRPLTSMKLAVQQKTHFSTKSFAQVDIQLANAQTGESAESKGSMGGFFSEPRYLMFSFSETDTITAVELF